MRFETKVAVVVRRDLPTWQKLNMTAFLVSSLGLAEPDLIGEPYEDADGNAYRPMFRQPVLVFAGDADDLRRVYERARSRDVELAIFTHDLFATGHDDANRAAVRAVAADGLDLTGLAMHADRRDVDRITKGLGLHE